MGVRSILGLVILTVVALSTGCGTSALDTGPPSNAVRYLALGDSLSMGIGADDQASAFPALLAKKWRAGGCAVALMNAGVGGATSAQILNSQVPLIAAFRPTIITLQVGTNDIVRGVALDEYRRNVQAVLDAANASGAQIIVLTQYEWYRSPWFRSPEGRLPNTDMAAEHDAYDEVMVAEARERHAQFVDLRIEFKEEADENQWFVDGIHPTQQAYDRWASTMAELGTAPC